MNIFELDVRRVCVDRRLNRCLWECGLSWDHVALLIADPACFVQSALGQRLGDLKRSPVVTIQFSYLDARHCEQDEQSTGSDVVLRGIDDTSMITAFVRRPFPNPQELPPLRLNARMRVQIVLRLKDRMATAHFHLDGDNLGVKKETYTLARNPLAYAGPINRLLREGGADVIVIDGAEPPRGCEPSAETVDAAQESSAAAMVPMMAESVQPPRSDAASPVTFSGDPTVHTLSVQFDTSTGEIAGCHSVDGTMNGAPQTTVVNGVVVNCMAYAPPPPPDPGPGGPPPSPGM